jgi:tyrosyl-tRNA synthetase
MGSASEAAAFLTRNVAEALPAGGLERRLAQAADEHWPLRVKLGLDPTAPDIHLGHTVVLQKLREFQDLGHRVVLIVGDFTARVGDPSGRTTTRPALSAEEIEANARTYEEQAMRVLRAEPALYELRFNSQWLDMSMTELFALARTTTVAQLLERDDFAKRYAAAQPISVLELLYPLLQGYDSVAVRSDVELGGTDQTFNLLLARDIQRHFGVAEQSVLTMPILPGTDGVEKMSKSVGNHVGIAEPPEEMYGKTMSLPDFAMDSWFELLAIARPPASTAPRDAKRALARSIVERFHGARAAAAAEEHFDRVHVRHEAPRELVEVQVAAHDGSVVHLPAVLADAFGVTRSEARRVLAQGGVKLDGEALDAADLDVDAGRLDGRVLQLGKRQFRRVRVG